MLLCLVLAALASGTETALTSVGRLRVRYLAEQGSEAAAILQRLRADPNRFLSTVLFTNTLALIVASTASALLSDALDRLMKADVEQVIVTDTIPIPADKLGSPLTVLSVAPLLAEAIIRVHENRSVSELFQQ